jgi:preprotein translocase subunit SecF
MTESFDRSVNTSVAVMLALLAMVVFGGDTLRLFNIALLFGMAVGTYSSVFVATPLVVLLAQREMEPDQIKARAEARAAAVEAEEVLEPSVELARPSNTIRPKRNRRP